ncbi:hypothetical protein Athai_00920 [Actinocatenispora thailandica]|uniref:Uncharacterized protein n=1 Tax=Actinocatenispora thailandica TaxID=227318 RepID=A0A7R7DJ46_9ACTN|nr:hypothetical protein Athai_00920 [Actinocatenispora thailandica]
MTVAEPGTRAFPRTWSGQTIPVGRSALRLSVRDACWFVPARSAERIARVIDLRAAGHRDRRSGTQEYDRTGPRP